VRLRKGHSSRASTYNATSCNTASAADQTCRHTHRTINRQRFIAVISRRHRLPQATRGEKVAG
jgi:hypothetical protein